MRVLEILLVGAVVAEALILGAGTKNLGDSQTETNARLKALEIKTSKLLVSPTPTPILLSLTPTPVYKLGATRAAYPTFNPTRPE